MSAWQLVWAVIASVVSSGALTWVLREWTSARLKAAIGHQYEIKRIQFEADLKREADASLERLRSELSIEAARRTVEHTRIHERRLEVLSELGERLFSLRLAFVEYTAPMRGDDQPDMKTSRLSLSKVLQEFDASLQPRRCFIPSPTLEKLEAFREQVRDIAWEFSTYVEFIDDGRSAPEFVKRKYQAWEAARQFVMDRSKALLADIHQDFQSILGIVDPSKAAPSSSDGSKLVAG